MSDLEKLLRDSDSRLKLVSLCFYFIVNGFLLLLLLFFLIFLSSYIFESDIARFNLITKEIALKFDLVRSIFILFSLQNIFSMLT